MSTTRILLLGPPGAGKGTQSARIAETFALEHITTGDALRSRKDMETEYGTPREYMDAGELVPDPVVNEIVQAAIDEADGFVLDGYPRNQEQAAYLDDIIDLDLVISLEVSRDELITRLTGRRVCSECGRNYHVEFAPPATDGVCDECGGDIVQRDDDTRDTVEERLAVFEETTKPVIDHYQTHHAYHTVDGEQSPDAVFEDLASIIEAVDDTA